MISFSGYAVSLLLIQLSPHVSKWHIFTIINRDVAHMVVTAEPAGNEIRKYLQLCT